MTKAEIINQIALKTGIDKIDVSVILETYIKEIKTSLIKGEPVHVNTFGTFALKKRGAKIGRNVHKNVTVEIPEHIAPVFKPSKEFVAAIRSVKR